jgi:hypothetical protein
MNKGVGNGPPLVAVGHDDEVEQRPRDLFCDKTVLRLIRVRVPLRDGNAEAIIRCGIASSHWIRGRHRVM